MDKQSVEISDCATNELLSGSLALAARVMFDTGKEIEPGYVYILTTAGIHAAAAIALEEESMAPKLRIALMRTKIVTIESVADCIDFITALGCSYTPKNVVIVCGLSAFFNVEAPGDLYLLSALLTELQVETIFHECAETEKACPLFHSHLRRMIAAH